jgi:tetratricopeptide (TPR) repeat protein
VKLSRATVLGLLVAVWAFGETPALEQARKLYQRTDYGAALSLLRKLPPEPDVLMLVGQCWYYSGDFKNAVEAFQKVVAATPADSTAHLWLGRAWGRRAETSNPFQAPVFASRARQSFEKAVDLDPKNEEAVSDLFQYYLEAPGFLGGGLDKASALTATMKVNDPVEYHYALAQLAERRKQYDLAEGQLRHTVELAPRSIGRLVDLARFLARQGKIQESEAVFTQAAKISPNDKRVLYARAQTYIQAKRNLTEARQLLQEYLKAPLTPDDPPREEALRLLKKTGGG